METLLESSLERFESTPSGLNYAQITIPLGREIWDTVADYLARRGPQILALKDRGRLRAATMDFAISFDEAAVALTINLPSHAVEAIARYGIDVELSIYRTGSDDDGVSA